MVQGDVTADLTTNNSHPCAVFDGVDDKLTCSVATAFDYSTNRDFSLAFWFKGNLDLAAADNRLLAKTKISTGLGWFMDINANILRFFTKNGTTYSITADAAFVYFKKWTHIALTVDRDVGCKLYINGVEIAATESNVANLATDDLSSGLGLHVGQLDNQGVNWLNGGVADLQIFSDKILSATEVSNIYNNIQVTDKLESAYDFVGGSYADRIGSNDLTNAGTYTTILDSDIAQALDDARVTTNDVYLCWDGLLGKVGTVHIEEA
tara:strand:+ start:4133 stop:4927 length:795 start_codon:yes stop_codon:yes gene_type:complete